MPEQVAYSQSEATSSSSTTQEINTANDLAKLQAEGRTLTTQELTDLNTRVDALEEMARIEDRLRILENRKRTREASEDCTSQSIPIPPLQGQLLSGTSSSYQTSPIQPSVEWDSPFDSSDTTDQPNKQTHYTHSIKVTPSYTLQINLSL